MIFDIQMRRATEYVTEKDYSKAQSLLKAIHQSCKTRDGQDDKTGKGSELIDIYALEMKIAFETKVKAKTKELYNATKDLRVDVKNPKSQAIIRECWGKMFGDDGQWPKAYAEFFVAFTTYQEAGQATPARKALSYVVIASMLAGTGLNPFDAREAAVFQKDEPMQPVINLRRAYERRDVNSFTKALGEFQQTADDWILSHMDSMIADFHKQYILKFVKPYRRLRVAFLANALQITEDVCESYLVQLVLDGLIHAKIDQVNGLLDLTQRTGGGDKKYQALEGWATRLESMGRNLPQPHSASQMHQFF
jgi:COP9 signalosome complex subunit 2